jgi:hypothetical protein
MAAHNLSIAACFYSKFVKSDISGEPWTPKRLLHYFGFHLRSKVAPSMIVAIDAHYATKISSIRAYHSQFQAHQGNQQVLADIEADARYWGSRINTQYGEPILSLEQVKITTAEALLAI